METLEIGGVALGPGERPFVVAEIGTNYRDDIELAEAMLEAAAAAGADAVKFQTHVADSEMAETAMRELDLGDLYDRIASYEMDESTHRMLRDECTERGVQFLSTPFSTAAVDLLEAVDVPAYKIGSGELTNYELLDRVAATGKPLLVSTGMADWGTIEQSVEFLKERTDGLALLYCVSSYPTPASEFNLGVIDRMKAEFGVPVGFSDHSQGIEAAVVAMARGADFVEKHFTLDRRLPGGDQEVSIEPEELAALTDYATLVHETRGEERQVRDAESSIAEWAHHSVVARTGIEAGEEFTRENITTKRPGTGVAANRYFEVVGRTATSDLRPDTVLTDDDVDW